MAIGAVLALRALWIWRESAASGVPFADDILGSMLTVVPASSRPLAAIAIWLLVILTTVPMFARNSLLVGVVAARVEDDHMLLWVPLSVNQRPSKGLRVERGETLVVTHRGSTRGLFNQTEKHSVKFTSAKGTLFAALDTNPHHYSIAGLRECAKAAGVKLDIRDTAKELDDSPR